MEPARNAPKFTNRDKELFQERITQSLQTLFPTKEVEIKKARIALERFIQDQDTDLLEGTLKNKLENILSIKEDLSELIPQEKVQSVFQSILQGPLTAKISSLKHLEQASHEERKRYLEGETKLGEETRAKRMRLEELQNRQESASVIKTHSAQYRQFEVENNEDIVTTLQELGASEDDVLTLSPKIWALLTDPNEGMVALQSLQSYIQEGIFSWEEITSQETAALAEVLLMYKPRIDTLLAKGMQKNALLQMEGEAIHAFFLENKQDDLYSRMSRFDENNELFFSLHPEAQLQALKATSVPENAANFLEDLEESAQKEQITYFLAALYHNYQDPLPPQALLFFQEPHCKSMAPYLFYELFDDFEEGSARWFELSLTQDALSTLFESVDLSENMHLLTNPELAIHLAHNASSLIEATTSPSPLSLSELLLVENAEKRALFITYVKNVRALLEQGVSFNELKDAEPKRLEWIVSRLDTLKPLLLHIPLQKLLFDQEIPLDTVVSCCLNGPGVSALLERGLNFSELIRQGDDKSTNTLIQNSSDTAWIIDVLGLNWQEFETHPLKEAIIENASKIRLLPGNTVTGLAGLPLNKEQAAYAFSYAASIPDLIKNRKVFEDLGTRYQEILKYQTPLHKEILRNPKKAAQFFLNNSFSLSYLNTLSDRKLHALFSNPLAIKGLLDYFPKLLSFEEDLANALLEGAEKVVKLLSQNIISKDALLSLGKDKVAFFIQEADALIEMAQKQTDAEPFIGQTFEQIQEALLKDREKEEIAKGKELLLATFPLTEEMLSEENGDYNTVIVPACKQAQNAVLLLEHAPALSILRVFEDLKRHPGAMMRILSHASSVSLLLMEGVTLERLYLLSNEEFEQVCKEASVRIEIPSAKVLPVLS